MRISDCGLRIADWPGCARRVAAVVAAGVALALAFSAAAQPHIGYVYPAGGQRGTAVEVVIGGQLLNGATNVIVSGDGITAQVLEYNRPLPQNQFNDLRDEFRTLQQKRRASRNSSDIPGQASNVGGTNSVDGTNVWTTADAARLEEIRARLLRNPPNRNGNPSIAETVTLQVAIASNTPLNECELRLRTPAGVSNPLLFRIGDLPETAKPAAQTGSIEMNLLRQLDPGRNPSRETGNPEIRVTLPAVVNGQILPGAVDRIRFHARAGQRLVAITSARQLIPYLADAVPGWFQPTLALFDAGGEELAYEDDYEFRPDPVLRCVIPRDGEYLLEIKDAIYRGRQDFVYRLELGELPFVTGIFPLGGRAGVETSIAVSGWNLSVTNQVFRPADAEQGIQQLAAGAGQGRTQTMSFAIDSLPECLEQEPNDVLGKAGKLSMPVIVNGRIGRSGDLDVFRIDGRAGDQVVAEVLARRLGSPLDSILRLTDANGREIASSDDCEDKGDGWNTHHADSILRFTLPKKGTYYLHLSDAARHGSAEHAYRLRISAPRPDFELRVTPSSLALRGGVGAPLTVYALRKDGFDGDITLGLVNAPAGFALDGGIVPAGADQARVTITPPPGARLSVVPLALEGRAVVNGRELVRAAVPAEDMMQAFAYRHLVPARELIASVAGRVASGAISRAEEKAVQIPAGGSAEVIFKMPAGFASRYRFELEQAPAGIQLERVVSNRFGAGLVLRSEAGKAKPGARGNLIVNIFSKDAQPANAANRRRAPVGVLPAIPFEIIPDS